jgi:tubulin alpha
MRFRGSLSTNLRDLVASTVPYHRLHCLMLNSISNDPYSIVLPSTKNLTRLAFNPVYSPYIRPKTYMAGALMYRGDVNHKDIVEELASIKSNKAFWFADWVPTGFRVGVSDQKPKTFNRF